MLVLIDMSLTGMPTEEKKKESLETIDFQEMDGLFSVQDPEFNPEIMVQKMRAQLMKRMKSIPEFNTLSLFEGRTRLSSALESLQLTASVYGQLGAKPGGLKGKLIFFVKRVIRFFMRRYLDQARDVHNASIYYHVELMMYIDQQTKLIQSCLERIEALEVQLNHNSTH